MNPRRLYRSRTDRAIAGIAGGMADYLEVDPTVVRILWILATIFTGGLVLLLYFILAFVIPLNPYGGGYPAGTGGTYQSGGYPGSAAFAGASGAGSAGGGSASTAGSTSWAPDWNAGWEAQRAARSERPGRAGLIIGTMLIVFGVIALADNVIPGWIDGRITGPAILLALGGAILVASVVRRDDRPTMPAPAPAATPAAAPAPEPAPASATAFAAEPPAAPAPWDPDATSAVSLDPESNRS